VKKTKRSRAPRLRSHPRAINVESEANADRGRHKKPGKTFNFGNEKKGNTWEKGPQGEIRPGIGGKLGTRDDRGEVMDLEKR